MIREELAEQLELFQSQGKLLEAQRLAARTRFDLEMLAEVGHCPGIENYSRPLSGKPPGATPDTLYDFFPDDFITFVDESHVTVPQVRAMYAGDRSRKETLVSHGFRLPSALDNRPLKFEEWEAQDEADLLRQCHAQRLRIGANAGRSHRTDHSTHRPARSGRRGRLGTRPGQASAR